MTHTEIGNGVGSNAPAKVVSPLALAKHCKLPSGKDTAMTSRDKLKIPSLTTGSVRLHWTCMAVEKYGVPTVPPGNNKGCELDHVN